jgi:hypothetical protein
VRAHSRIHAPLFPSTGVLCVKFQPANFTFRDWHYLDAIPGAPRFVSDWRRFIENLELEGLFNGETNKDAVPVFIDGVASGKHFSPDKRLKLKNAGL